MELLHNVARPVRPEDGLLSDTKQGVCEHDRVQDAGVEKDGKVHVLPHRRGRSVQDLVETICFGIAR